jgi:hypothetical protein
METNEVATTIKTTVEDILSFIYQSLALFLPHSFLPADLLVYSGVFGSAT